MLPRSAPYIRLMGMTWIRLTASSLLALALLALPLVPRDGSGEGGRANLPAAYSAPQHAQFVRPQPLGLASESRERFSDGTDADLRRSDRDIEPVVGAQPAHRPVSRLCRPWPRANHARDPPATRLKDIRTT